MKKERIATFDVARGFTVFIMPGVHSMMLYSMLSVQHGAPGAVAGFLAEGPGAQLFLLLMGLSVTLAKRKTPMQVISRAIKLFALAYLLNYVRLVIPMSLFPMPADFLANTGISDPETGKITAFLIGDILQTAAIACLVCGLLFLLPRFHIWASALAVAVIVCIPFVMQNTGSDTMLFGNLFTGKPPAVFFPVIPWIVYPLAGLALGKYFQTSSPPRFYTGLLIAGALLYVSGKLIMHYEPAAFNNNFYNPGPGAVLYHLGIVCVWLYGCNKIITFFANNVCFDLLRWLSRHITLVYFIQWIVVLWLLPVYQYHTLGLVASVAAIIINSALSFGLTWLWIHFAKRWRTVPVSAGKTLYPENL